MEIPVTDAPDALSDAWLTAQIRQRQIRRLEALRIWRVGDLRRVRVAAHLP